VDSMSISHTVLILAVALATFLPALILGVLVGYGFSRIVGKTEEGDNVAAAVASGFAGAAVGTPIAAVTTIVLWAMFGCFAGVVLSMADILPDL